MHWGSRSNRRSEAIRARRWPTQVHIARVLTYTLTAVGVALAGASLVYIIRTHLATGRNTEAIQANTAAIAAIGRGDRTPKLAVWLDHPAPSGTNRVIFRVRNDGPTGLDSVVVYRPRTTDKITYPIAHTGRSGGWENDEVHVGLALDEQTAVTLCRGSADALPEYRCRVKCRSGDDTWTVVVPLPTPRGKGLRAVGM